LAWGLEPDIATAEIEDLLYSSTGVEHQGKQRVVALSTWTSPINALKKSLNLFTIQVLDRHITSAALETNVDHSLEPTEVIWELGRKETSKHVDRAEACIARRDTVMPFSFEKIQEPNHTLRCEVFDLKVLNAAICVSRHKLQ
jgi:hypothetical protein